MTDPSVYCGSVQLATVRIPGHDDVEAVIYLHSGATQPAEADHHQS